MDGFDKLDAQFVALRKRVSSDVDELARKVGERTVAPTAKRKAGRLKVDGDAIASHIIVRKARSGAILTTDMRGMRARAVSLLERGGVVDTEIQPKHGWALGPGAGGGHPVARVTTARIYRSRKFLEGARDERLDEFGQELRDELVHLFEMVGFEVT